MDEKDIKRFWDKVDIRGPNDCWEWKAGKFPAGYGLFWNNGNCTAHRISYELIKGEVPKGLFILHSCDNPPCCNPNRLRAGTPAENMRDVVERNRHPDQAGDKNYNAKLTPDQVLDIRKKFLPNGENRYDLAAEYRVSVTAILQIINRTRWGSI